MGPTPRLIRPRVVFDTNVLVSALLFRRGLLGWLVDVWQTERVRPLGSKATIAELLRVLGYPKFRLAAGDRQALLEEYLPWCEAIVVPPTVDVPDCRDPEDRMFLELAARSQCRRPCYRRWRPAGVGTHLRYAHPDSRDYESAARLSAWWPRSAGGRDWSRR